jgi:hypothetical protein
MQHDFAEERLNDTLNNLPIVGRKKQQLPPEDQRKWKLNEILADALPDVHARLTGEVIDRLMEVCASRGKKTTRGSIVAAVSGLRKNGAPKPKLQPKTAKVQQPAATKSRIRETKPAKTETFSELLVQLESAIGTIIQERDEAVAKLARITEAIR